MFSLSHRSATKQSGGREVHDAFSRTLVLAPHCDDETLGVGGLIYRLRAEGAAVRVVVMLNASVQYISGLQASADRLRKEFEGACRVLGVEDRCVEEEGGVSDYELVGRIDRHLLDYKPTALLWSYPSHHQHHQRLNDACRAALRLNEGTLRLRLAATYEYPHLFPNFPVSDHLFLVDISGAPFRAKIDALDAYEIQIGVRESWSPLSKKSVEALARWRGSLAGIEHAEALHLVKWVL